MTRILIVDDEENIRMILTNVFSDAGYDVDTAADGKQALERIPVFRPELILLDKNMPRMDGMSTLRHLRKHCPEAVVIMITAYGDVTSAVEAMKAGAYDYIEKPFDNRRMLLLLQRAESHYRLQDEVTNLRSAVHGKYAFEHIIGNSQALAGALESVKSVCETDASVLITGESGTGKELIAKAIHYNSRRRNAPLVTVNCGAIPVQLTESELFGHEKGAFTDAREMKTGKFEQAKGGTLFLDEIGELPLDAQVKLLRVLEDRKVVRLGGKQEIPVNIRLISATNNDLNQRVRNQTFRLDLFYRLNLFTIHLPPLRERPEDIPMLVNHFIRKHNEPLHTHISGCTNETLTALMSYVWPGNIRDLENAVQSAMIVCKTGKLRPEHLPVRLTDISDSSERNRIIEALKLCRYNKTDTAEYLGISRKTLFNKIRKFDLDE